MQIPEKLLKKWETLRSPEDTKQIAEKIDVTDQTIRNAFADKKCSDRVFTAMASYYEEKAKTIKQYV